MSALLWWIESHQPVTASFSVFVGLPGAFVSSWDLSVSGKSSGGLFALSDLNSWTQDRRVSTILALSGGGFSFRMAGDLLALISRTFIVLPLFVVAFRECDICELQFVEPGSSRLPYEILWGRAEEVGDLNRQARELQVAANVTLSVAPATQEREELRWPKTPSPGPGLRLTYGYRTFERPDPTPFYPSYDTLSRNRFLSNSAQGQE